MDGALLSSERHDYETPDEVLELIREMGPISLDPCTTAQNPTRAKSYFYPPLDALSLAWPYGGLVYCNPPYGLGRPKRKRGDPPQPPPPPWVHSIGQWVERCIKHTNETRLAETELIMLVPARTDTLWYDRCARTSDARCEWRGRLTFKGQTDPAGFPSALFYWGARPHLFCHVFQDRGRVAVTR